MRRGDAIALVVLWMLLDVITPFVPITAVALLLIILLRPRWALRAMLRIYGERTSEVVKELSAEQRRSS